MVEIDRNRSKQWKSVEICGKRSKSMENGRNRSKSIKNWPKLVKNDGYRSKTVEIGGKQLKSVENGRNRSKTIRIDRERSESAETVENSGNRSKSMDTIEIGGKRSKTIEKCLRKKSRLSLKNDMPPRDKPLFYLLLICLLKITKVIKGEFEKLESVKIIDVSLTYITSLEIFNEEFNRMSRIKDDLFTYEVEIAEVTNIPCDLKKEYDLEQQMSQESDNDLEYDPSDVEFIEWLALKNFNYKTMDHYTTKALWIYWAGGDDEVELIDEESSNFDDEDEVAKIFRIETNLFDFETPLCRAFKEFNYLLQISPDVLTKDIDVFKTYEQYKDDWIYEWNKDVPWVHERP
nr:VIER F-box protein 2 [Tanacetum cinerariifolium]